MEIKSKPYQLLPITVFVLTLFYFSIANTFIDFELFNGFVIITLKNIFWLLVAGNSIVWFSYIIAHKLMFSKILTWIHISATIIITSLIVVSIFFGSYLFYPKGYAEFCDYSLRSHSVNNEDMGVLILIMLLSQFVFIINFTGRFIKKLF